MKLAFFVLSLGVVPTYMALEHFDWPWWLGYAVLFGVYRLLNSVWEDIAAANNIVMAQVTIRTLTDDARFDVEDYAEQMHSVFEGDPSAVFENEWQELAYLALAMDDMGIAPVILFRKWFDVPNPSKAPTDGMLARAMEMVADRITAATKNT